MEIIKGSLADNSQSEQPYRTTGEIEINGAGVILSIYVNGILVDFKIRTYEITSKCQLKYREYSIPSVENPVLI